MLRSLLLPLFCALFVSACTGGRPVKIVRTDQSTVLGTLVAMRPDAVDIQTVDGARVTEPRAGIASIAVPDATELASLGLTEPRLADASGAGDMPNGGGRTSPGGAAPGDGSIAPSGDVAPTGRTSGPDGSLPGGGKDAPPDQRSPETSDPTSDTPRQKDAPRVPGRAANDWSTGTVPTDHRPERSDPDEPLRPVDHGPAVVIPADTVLAVSLDAPLQSDTSRVEERVGATLTAPVILNRTRVLPAGTHIRGDVTEAVPAKQANGRGRLTIRFHTVVIDGEDLPLEAAPIKHVAQALTRDDAKKVGIGAATGAAIGGIWSKTKRGLGIGAAAGAGATAIAVSRNNEARLNRGAGLRVRLTAPLVLRGLR